MDVFVIVMMFALRPGVYEYGLSKDTFPSEAACTSQLDRYTPLDGVYHAFCSPNVTAVAEAQKWHKRTPVPLRSHVPVPTK